MDINSFLTGHRELAAKYKQLHDRAPAAAAYALNGVAYEIRKQVQQDLPKWVKITRNFLPNSIVYEKATNERLTAVVGFAKRANFVTLLESGGVKMPNKTAIAIPVDVNRSGRGGISMANRPAAVLTKKNVFTETINGIAGIWQSTKKVPLKLLYLFKPQVKYRNKFLHFMETANRIKNATLVKRFEESVTRILLK